MILIFLFFWIFCGCTFLEYALDKRRAILGRRRTPEAVLLIIACIGGAFGALSAMVLFRHKTNKPKFCITVPIFAILQIAALCVLSYLRLF